MPPVEKAVAMEQVQSGPQSRLDLLQISRVANKFADAQKELDAVGRLVQTDKLKRGEVLWDVAGRALTQRAKITGEPTDHDSRFRELNRIMQNSGFAPAHLDGKRHITDADLPDSWNSITNRKVLIIYTEKQLADLREQVKKGCEVPPVLPNTGTPSGENGGTKPGGESGGTKPGGENGGSKPGGENGGSQPGGENGGTKPGGENGGPKPGGENGGTKPGGENGGTKPGGENGGTKPGGENGGTKPGGENGGTKPGGDKPAAEPDYLKFCDQLRKEHDQLSATFQESNKGQGVIGRMFDAAKNNAGMSASDGGLSVVWSNVLDRDSGSDAINRQLRAEGDQISNLEAAAKNKNGDEFKRLYKDITGEDFDPNRPSAHTLRNGALARRYEQSQSTGVETITDAAAAIAAIGASRFGAAPSAGRALTLSLGTGAVLGAGAKAGLKQIDGRYANLREDLLTGGIWGATVPLGDIAGSSVSRAIGNKYGLLFTGNFITGRLETQGAGLGLRALSAAAKTGVSGTIFGASDGATRSILEEAKSGQGINPYEVGKRTLIGAGFGFAGGTLLGMAADGIADGFKRRNPASFVSPEAKVVNGVEVPVSGVASLDDASKIMGADSTAFARKAASDPYGAVTDAAQLFDEHGVNIRKFDAQGRLVVPPQFSDALDLVQTVDGLTAQSKLSISEKVPIVKSADEFVAGPKAPAVQETVDRVKSDPNYQEIIRLTREQQGDQAAEALEQSFEKGLQKDIKLGTATERISNPSGSLDEAFAKAQSQAETAYKEKAADFFKDMTDPAQRARLNELVDQIFDKFNPRPLTREQLGEILAKYSPQQQQLATALLEQSANNTSEVGLRVRMQALRDELQKVTGGGIPSNVYTLSPDSSGNMLGYLFRKSNSSSMAINNIDRLAEDVANGQIPSQIVLFDDISSQQITPAQRQLLSKIPKVYVVDVGAFTKGVNIIDASSGPEAVASKLQSLVKEAERVASANPALLPTGVAQDVLTGSVDRAATALGPNVKVIRESGNWHHTSMPSAGELSLMDPVDALYARMMAPKATKEEIAKFLTGYAGEDREMAARMLAEGAHNNSFPAIIAKAQQVNEQINTILRANGANKSDFLMVVDKDPGGSTHLVSYLYGKANGLESGNYISSRQLNKMIADGTARGKVVAYMDDTIYSGSQAAGMLDSNVSSFMPFKKVVVGGFGAYDKGITRIEGTHLAKVGKVSVATADNYQPFYSSKNKFFGQLGVDAQARVRRIGGSEGFGSVQGSQIWAYMYPDNNLNFFGPQFAGSVLKLPGP